MMNFSADPLLRLIGVPASHRAPPSHLKCRVMDKMVQLCHSPPPLSLQSISPLRCALFLSVWKATLLCCCFTSVFLPASLASTPDARTVTVCLAHKRRHHTSCVFVAMPPIKGIITLFTKPLGLED